MPVHTVPVDFAIRDAATLRFVDHCLWHWNDFALCSDAHVAFMKHLARSIFNMPPDTPLVGILFEVCVVWFFLCLPALMPAKQDATLALLRADDMRTFYTVSRLGDERFGACIVLAQDFAPSWGMGTGFWDGLRMAESQVMNGECAGPTEDC
jgi:hypothetical protein